MNTIHLEPQQVPQQLRGIDGYSGNKYKAEVRETVTINGQAGIWEGGTHSRCATLAMVLGYKRG